MRTRHFGLLISLQLIKKLYNCYARVCLRLWVPIVRLKATVLSLVVFLILKGIKQIYKKCLRKLLTFYVKHEYKTQKKKTKQQQEQHRQYHTFFVYSTKSGSKKIPFTTEE